jgi:hypothetical protein
LELARRRLLRISLIVLAVAALAAVGIRLATDRPPPERIEGHLFAIPNTESRITVEVLNGTGRSGLARTATRTLRQRGLDVVFLGNADSAHDSTQVLVRRGDSLAGGRVAEALGFGRVIGAPDTMRRVDVTVILGDDYRPVLPLHP